MKKNLVRMVGGTLALSAATLSEASAELNRAAVE
jgi:hypothetical protein